MRRRFPSSLERPFRVCFESRKDFRLRIEVVCADLGLIPAKEQGCGVGV
jgi:hypothetical protein